MTHPSSSQLRTTALIAALALLWGSGFFWIKLALGGFTPTQLTFGRLALGALVLAPIVVLRQLGLPRGPAFWGHIAVSALIANAIPYTLFAVAEQTTSSSLAGVVNSTTPLWAAALAYLAGVDRAITRRRAAGLLLGFAGALVVLAPWSTSNSATLTGLVACAGAAASYGLAYVYQARYLTNRGCSPLALTTAQLAIATGMVALTLPFSGLGPSNASLTAITAIVVLGALGTGLALVINFMLITTEGPTSASTVTYLLPVVAVALGIAVLHESVGWQLPVGGFVILLGVALVQGRPEKDDRRPKPGALQSGSRITAHPIESPIGDPVPLNTSNWRKPALPALSDDVDNQATARMILDVLFGRHPEYMIAEPGKALLINAVRLMDKTVTEYLAARDAAITFAEGGSEIRAGRPSDYFRVLDHLETSIGVLHRTILHLDEIRAQKDAPNIERAKRNALNAATTQINYLRDKIEHAAEHLRKNPGADPYPVLYLDSDSFRLDEASVTYANFAQWIGQASRLLRTLLPS